MMLQVSICTKELTFYSVDDKVNKSWLYYLDIQVFLPCYCCASVVLFYSYCSASVVPLLSLPQCYYQAIPMPLLSKTKQNQLMPNACHDDPTVRVNRYASNQFSRRRRMTCRSCGMTTCSSRSPAIQRRLFDHLVC